MHYQRQHCTKPLEGRVSEVQELFQKDGNLDMLGSVHIIWAGGGPINHQASSWVENHINREEVMKQWPEQEEKEGFLLGGILSDQ